MKTFLLIVLGFGAFIGSAAADDKLDVQKSSKFWEWFASHSNELARTFAYKDNKSQAERDQATKDFEEVAARVKDVQVKLVPFFEGGEKSTTMIISVRGESAYFPLVDQFVQAAPVIPGWKFQALKSPLDPNPEMEIQTGTVSFKIGDLCYTRTGTKGSNFAIVLYFPKDVTKNQDGYDGLAFNLVEDAMGERLAATVQPKVTARQLSPDSPKDAKPFVGLHDDIAAP